MPGAVSSRRAANEVESTITTGTVASLTEAWTYASGHPGPVGSPAWSPSGVHVVAGDEDPFGTGAAYVLSLQALRPATGEVLWRTEPGLSDSSSLVTNPVVVGDTVYWSSGVPNVYGNWQLHGYDTATGERSPQIDDVVVDTARGRTLGHWKWGFGEGGCDVSVGVTDLDDPASSECPCRSPDTARVRSKMIYASSKERFKRELDGIQVELQATDPTEVGFDVIQGRAN
jgi:hypothetical protein